mgnify:CR=1 FL=1
MSKNFRVGRIRRLSYFSRFQICASFSAVSLALLGILCIFPYAKSHLQVYATIDETEYGLTLSANSAVNLDLSPTTAGTLIITKDTVSASTNSPSGYKLYLSTVDIDSNIYLDGDNANNTNNKKITKTVGTYDSPIALATSSTTPAVWGYAIAGLNNFDPAYNETAPNDTSKFASLPHLASAQLIHEHDGPANSDPTDIYYGVKANLGISPGTYTATINYTTVSDISSIIGGEAVIDPNILPTSYPSNQQVTITTSLKTFLDLGEITTTINNQPCINLTVISQHPLTLTCQVPAGLPASQSGHDVIVNIPKFGKSYTIPNGLKVLPSMQSFTNTTCSTLPLNQQYQYIDTRDNKIYYIARLKMNRETGASANTACWMTQNLGLDLSTATTLTSDNTDLPSGTNWTPANSTINFTGTANNTPVPGWVDSETVPYSANPGDVYYYTSGNNSNDTTYPSLSACISAGHTEDECKHYSVGNYYNFTSAIAMNDSSAYNTEYQTIPQSICPKGWKLPTSMTGPSTAGDLAKLLYANNITDTLATQAFQNIGYTTNGFNDLRANPLYFARNGYVYSGSLFNPGTRGSYRSSSVGSPGYHYGLYFYLGYLDPTNYTTRFSGFSVRCLARSHVYTLNFDASGGSNAPATQTTEIAENSATFTLPTTIPTKPNYVFKGWATTNTATTPDYAWNGSAFSPSTITLQHTAPTKTLYAVWQANDMSGITYMQEITPTICQNSTLDQQYKLKDSRDNKEYWVARLKMTRDGSETACWMTQNLALDLSTATTLTSDNTDLPSGTNWIPANSTINFTGTANNTPVPGWVDSYTAPYSANPGDVYHYTSGSNVDDITYSSLSACTSAGHTADECKHYSAGNYYNFTSAIAMNDSSAYNTEHQTVPQSICPKGWKLPTSMTGPSTAGDLAKLLYANNITDTLATQASQNVGYTSSGFTNLRANPLYFLRSGNVISAGSLRNPGYAGHYSSSSVLSSVGRYYLYFNSGSLSPTNHSNRNLGFSVRCVVR